ncbi:MAG: hypothetical protein ACLUD0_20500 [Eubacterium ramulus]
MSFSGEMKEEIARLIPMQEADVRAELSAIIRFCGRIIRLEDSVAVLVETENVALAKTFVKLIKKAFDIQVQLEIRRHGAGKIISILYYCRSDRRICFIRRNFRSGRNSSRQLRDICIWSAQAEPRDLLADVRKQACLYQRGISLCRFYE